MAHKTEHLVLGAAGEDAARNFLERQGWHIVACNWRPSGVHQGLELDIIARHKKELVFVEVKTRQRVTATAQTLVVPVHEAFTPQKKARIARAAQHYLAAHSLWDTPCRFDLVCVERAANGHWMLEHHIHVIELGNALDSSDTSWQPW